MKECLFVCKRCGYKQRMEVLSADEAADRRRKGLPVGSIVCPNCGSWEYDLH